MIKVLKSKTSFLGLEPCNTDTTLLLLFTFYNQENLEKNLILVIGFKFAGIKICGVPVFNFAILLDSRKLCFSVVHLQQQFGLCIGFHYSALLRKPL